MEVLLIQHFNQFNLLEQTYLDQDVASGASSLLVKNTNNFDTSHQIWII